MAIKQLLFLLLACCRCPWACGYSSPSTVAMPVCVGSGAPAVVLSEPLAFCGIVGPSCCDPAADAALGEEFRAMNVPESDAACATIVRAILCEKCIAYPSPQPPVNDVTTRSVPPRCASSRVSSAPPQPQQDAVCLERLAGGIYRYRVALPGLCNGAPHPRASATPPEKAAGISWLLWVALISIPGFPTALAIYFFRACLFGSCRGEDE